VGVGADAGGFSHHTVRKWASRYRCEGLAGLADRSSAPKHSPRRTPACREREVVALRRQWLTGDDIAQRLAMPRSTVCAIIRRRGLSQLPPTRKPAPVMRYEHKQPGDMLHLDVKKLGKIGRVGHRIHGDRRRCSRGIGWEFVHVCIDDHSRVAYVEVLADEKGATAAGFLRRAVAWYAARGVTCQRVLTDNGSCYLSSDFAEARHELGLKHLRTRPYTPRTNGKAERLIKTLLREWAYAKPYQHSGQRTRALRTYLNRYNHRRPHGSLGRRPPMSRLDR
jgi:transposase InsO family protein